MKLTLNKTEYTVRGDKPVLHLFCRNEKGERVKLEVFGFEPYFYTTPYALSSKTKGVTRIEHGYKRHNGQECDKVFVKIPKDVSIIRETLTDTWEANILFPNRFLIDTGIRRGIEIEDNIDISAPFHYKHLIPIDDPGYPIRVLYFDAEIVPYEEYFRGIINGTQYYTIDEAKSGKHVISHISLVDSSTGTRYLLKCNPYLKKERTKLITSEEKLYNKEWVNFERSKEKNIMIATFRDQKEMLINFMTLIRDLDCDVIEGYNIESFDLPVIFNTCSELKISPNIMSTIKVVIPPTTIYGIDVLDVYKMIKMNISKQLESFTLDYVSSKYVKDRVKLDIRGHISPELRKIIKHYTGSDSVPSNIFMWIFYYGTSDDKRLLDCYNIEDSVVAMRLDEIRRLTTNRRMFAKGTGTHMGKTFSTTHYAHNHLLRYSKDKFVMPNVEDREEGDITGEGKGAEVLDPRVGMFKYVLVVDYSSLYPMIMMANNISPETKSKTGDIDIGNGVKFNSEPKSIFYNAFNDLIGERNRIKKEMKKYSYEDPRHKNLDDEQFALKQQINSYTGYLKFIDLDLYNSVTFAGRTLILLTRDIVQQKTPYRPLYGDTDSVFIHIGDNISLDEAKRRSFQLVDLLNKAYDIYLKGKGIKEHNISVKPEKLGIFCQTGTKKRYGFKVLWDGDWKGDEEAEYYFKGLQLKRSDNSQLCRDLQENIWKMVLDGKPKEDITNYLKDKYKMVMGDIDIPYVSKPESITKPFSTYKGSSANHIKIRAARNSLQAGIEIQVGQKYKMLPIKNMKYNNPFGIKLWNKKENGVLFSNDDEIHEILKWCEIDRDEIVRQMYMVIRDISLIVKINFLDIVSDGTMVKGFKKTEKSVEDRMKEMENI